MNNATIYLDNAATTFPKPEEVYRTIDTANRTMGGNAFRGHSPVAVQAAQTVQETRVGLAALFGVANAEHVVLAPSATVALNQVIQGIRLPAGATVYVSPLEHNSVLRPIEHMRISSGWDVHVLPFDPLTLNLDSARTHAQFAQLPPDVVFCTQASNVFGTMPDLLTLAAITRQHNPRAVIVVDGAQAGGLYPLALNHGMIDYFVFSGHKSLHGPNGIAGFILSGSQRPQPILFGGTGSQSELLDPPDEGTSTFEVGSPNIPAIAGLGASLRWLTEEQRQLIRDHGALLMTSLENGLRAIPEVTVYAPQGPRIPVLSFTLAHMSPQEIDTLLGPRGFNVRVGLHCSPWAHRLAGTIRSGGTIRVSPGVFNTATEIDQFLETVDHICSH